MELPERGVFFAKAKHHSKSPVEQPEIVDVPPHKSELPTSPHHQPESMGWFGLGGKKKQEEEKPNTTKLPQGVTRKSLFSGWEAVQEDSLNLQRGKEQADDLQTFENRSQAAKKGAETRRLNKQAQEAEAARQVHPTRPQPRNLFTGRAQAAPTEPSTYPSEEE